MTVPFSDALFQQSMLAQSIVTVDGTHLHVNAALGRLLAEPASALVGRALSDSCLAEPDKVVVEELLRSAAAGSPGGVLAFDVRITGGRAATVDVTWTRTVCPDGGPAAAVLAFHDVTEARHLERELRRSALHDALTGLPNRALLLDRLEQALVRDRGRTAVVHVGLDHFKLVNDSRGYTVGDELLIAVGQRLLRSARPQDTVARLGGDEFVVLMETVDEKAAQELVRQLVDDLAPALTVEGADLHVAASVGVALSPPGAAADLLRSAETAMRAAKAAGRGRVRYFDPSLAAEVEDQYVLGVRLRAAIANDLLDLAYQPIVDLSTGAVVGVEALARWDDSVFGQVAPARFVRTAEVAGFSPELDRWAVRRALSDLRQLRRAGCLPLTSYVSVNLCASNLDDPSLEELIVSTTASSGLAPSNVMLEITEDAVMKETDRSIALLRRLRSKGFLLALDDFGTGQSSLAYLRDLPINVLKLDRSFVAGLREDTDALAIAASVVDLGRAMGMSVIAEGVEDEEQAKLLRALGCQSAQGWLWSQARSPKDLLERKTSFLDFSVGPASGGSPAGRRSRRAPVGEQHGLHRLLSMHRKGASLTTIAAALNRDGYLTPKGTRWHQTSVSRVVSDHAYPGLLSEPRL